MINRFTTINLDKLLYASQHHCAEFARDPFGFLLHQRLTPDEIAFVQIYAEAKTGFVRCGGGSNIGSKIFESLFQTQRIEHLVTTKLHAKFFTSFNEHIPHHRGTVVGNIQFPTQFTGIAHTLR